MSGIESFVEERLGTAALSNLNRIRIGGANNKKGRDYENFFQLFKAFELASQDIDHEKYLLSCQELAFIDDVCHWDLEKSIKHNFQAKNSSGAAANWTSEIRNRCKQQTILDKKFHEVAESRSYLVVSCERKKTNSLKRIPVKLSQLNTCIFFPYCANLVDLLEQTNLRQHISTLIGTDEPSDVDYAANLW